MEELPYLVNPAHRFFVFFSSTIFILRHDSDGTQSVIRFVQNIDNIYQPKPWILTGTCPKRSVDWLGGNSIVWSFIPTHFFRFSFQIKPNLNQEEDETTSSGLYPLSTRA